MLAPFFFCKYLPGLHSISHFPILMSYQNFFQSITRPWWFLNFFTGQTKSPDYSPTRTWLGHKDMAQLHYLIIYNICFLPFVCIIFQKKVLNFSRTWFVWSIELLVSFFQIFRKIFPSTYPCLSGLMRGLFLLGLVISALFWPGKGNFDRFWSSFKIFDRFWPITKLTANYKDCKPKFHWVVIIFKLSLG